MNKRKILYISLFAIVIIGCIWAFISAAVITRNFKKDVINQVTETQELKAKGIFVTESKDGEKYWEIYADEGQMDSKSKVAILYNPTGNFYKDNEVVMSFKSNKGTYQEDNKKIILYDDTLIIYKDGTKITANKFIWQGQDNDIFAIGNVAISRVDGKFVITGEKASLRNNLSHFTVQGKSESKIYDSNGVTIK